MKKLLMLASSLMILSAVKVSAVDSKIVDLENEISELEITLKEKKLELQELTGETTEEAPKLKEKVIVDDKDFTIKFKELITGSESYYGPTYEFVFLVENKTDRDINIQVRNVSINDFMLEDGMVRMSQEISSGKKAKTSLLIRADEGEELPDLEGNLDFKFSITDWEDYVFSPKYEASIPLK